MFTLPFKAGGGCCDSCATSTPCSCDELPCCVCDDSYGGSTLNVTISQITYQCNYYGAPGSTFNITQHCDSVIANFSIPYVSGCSFNGTATGTVTHTVQERSWAQSAEYECPQSCTCDIDCTNGTDEWGQPIVPLCGTNSGDVLTADVAVTCTGTPGAYGLTGTYYGGASGQEEFFTVSVIPATCECGGPYTPVISDTSSCCSGTHICSVQGFEPFTWVYEPYVGAGSSWCCEINISWSITSCNPVYPG